MDYKTGRRSDCQKKSGGGIRYHYTHLQTVLRFRFSKQELSQFQREPPTIWDDSKQQTSQETETEVEKKYH